MTLMQALLPRARRFFGRAKPPQSQKGLYVQDMGNAGMRSYMVMPGQAVWMDRNYPQFALEAYIRNVIAHRAISMVATASASVKFKLYAVGRSGVKREIKSHPILSLLKHPSPMHAMAEFFQALYQYKMISGNAFIKSVGPNSGPPTELHLLRPDRVAIIAGKNAMPQAYRYTINNQSADFPVNSLTGVSSILHLRYFNPLNDWYGLSPIEAAAYSIDQHNQAGAWNQSLMQNGARPSGALVVRVDSHGGGGMLSEDQYNRVKNQIDEQFSGPVNAGRPLLLEGGLDWKEMSLTPKDMDFVQAKNASARDIALAFGVPPQLLGIPGDNTYSNLQEARLALWEQTVMPLVHATGDAFSRWLLPQFDGKLELRPDADGISVLADRNQATWTRVEQASFLTDDEKRAAVGYGPLTPEQTRQLQTQSKSSLRQKYSPDQPRDDHGRWTSGGGDENNNSNDDRMVSRDADTNENNTNLLPKITVPGPDGNPVDKANIFVGGALDQTVFGNVENSASLKTDTYGDNYYANKDQLDNINQQIAQLPEGQTVNLIGHSLGADTAAQAAVDNPGKIDTLVTIDPVSRDHPDFTTISNSVNTWVNVNATGNPSGSTLDDITNGNLAAGVGGDWENGPNGHASMFISAPLNHADFDQLMNYPSSNGGPSAQKILNDE